MQTSQTQQHQPVRSALVTAYFRIPGSPRGVEFYMANAKATLSLPFPMVVFCAAEDVAAIRRVRDAVVGAETRFVEMDLFADPETRAIADKIRADRLSKDDYQRNTPEYFIVMAFKWRAVFIASHVLKATHYVWLDFGGGHAISNIERDIAPIMHDPHPKVGMCMLRYTQPSATEHPRFVEHCYTLSCMAGGLFTVQAQYVGRFYALCQAIFFQQVAQGTGYNDQTVFAILYNRHPELFTLFFGDYDALASSYHTFRSNAAMIIGECAEQAVAVGNWELALLVLDKVLGSDVSLPLALVHHAFRIRAQAERMRDRGSAGGGGGGGWECKPHGERLGEDAAKQ